MADDTDDDLTPLCLELASLYRALGAALEPTAREVPDRSSQMRPALLWCATHQAPHRRDEWRDANTGPDAPEPPEGWCEPGQDPRRASVLVAPALVATPPKWSQTNRAYGSASPVDLGILDTQREIETETVALARLAREALGHRRRDRDPIRALSFLPALLEALPDGHVLHRRVPMLLAAMRRQARWALDLDRRPFPLGVACESTRDPYPATWLPSPDGTTWEPAAEWTDGVCREYDVRASRPDATPAVDVWRVSMLYVRDTGAPPESDDAAVRCPGCRRVWRGAEGKAQLYALLRPELGEALVPDSV